MTRKDQALDTIEHIRKMSNISKEAIQMAVQQIQTHANVAIHFHPDRLDEQGKSVIENLLKSGLYKNQFETKLSNGGLSPYKGGQRDLWENDLFNGAYSNAAIAGIDRPKYGALNLMQHADGPCPRFGACYFILQPEVAQRCTFTYLDSYLNPKQKGTIHLFEDIFASLLSDAFELDFALGKKEIRPAALIQYLCQELSKPFIDPAHLKPARNLNHYIEAQIHGPIQLDKDIKTLVADPSFKQTPIETYFEKLCTQYEIELYWHAGFKLEVDKIPKDFRGPEMPSLAKRIASNHFIDAYQIGLAASNLKRHPQHWTDRGDYKHCLQELKLLWHVLVRYGKMD